MKDYTFGMGFFERILLVVIIALLFGGLITFFSGSIFGALSVLMVFIFFVASRFVEFWAFGISILFVIVWFIWRAE